MKAIVDNFQEITKRKKERKKMKEANDAIEAARNKEAAKRSSENTNRRSGDGRCNEPRPGGTDKQFKQPT